MIAPKKKMRPNAKYLLLFFPITVIGFTVPIMAVNYVHNATIVNTVLGVSLVAVSGISYLLGQLSVLGELHRLRDLAVLAGELAIERSENNE